MSTVGWKGRGHLALEFPAGVDASGGVGVAPPGRMRLRYNNQTGNLEVSASGSSYTAVTLAAGSPWNEAAGVVSLDNDAWNVAVGASAMSGGGEKLRVVGQSRMESSLGVPVLDLGVDAQRTIVKIRPTQPAYPTVTIETASFLLNGVEDQVTMWGHNLDNGIPAQPRCWVQQEYNFKTGPAGGDPVYSEFFWQWTGPSGAPVIRPISAIVNWTTQLAQWGLVGQGVWTDTPGNQRLLLQESGRIVHTNSAVAYWWASVHNEPIVAGTLQNLSPVELLRVSSNVVANEVFMDVNQQCARWRISSPGGLYLGLGAASTKAILEADSTTRGFLPPRMTEAQRDAITSPPAGLLIYNTSTGKLNVRGAVAWETITSA